MNHTLNCSALCALRSALCASWRFGGLVLRESRPILSGRSFPEGFAERLRAVLRHRNKGRLPRAAHLARALNESDPLALPVAAETVRRWMRGLSMPELYRFRSLCCFLRCEPAELSYLLLGDDARPSGKDLGPLDIREALHQLIASAESEALSAAYIAVLMASGQKTPASGGVRPATVGEPTGDDA